MGMTWNGDNEVIASPATPFRPIGDGYWGEEMGKKIGYIG